LRLTWVNRYPRLQSGWLGDTFINFVVAYGSEADLAQSIPIATPRLRASCPDNCRFHQLISPELRIGLLRSLIWDIIARATSFSFFPIAHPTLSRVSMSIVMPWQKLPRSGSSRCPLFPFVTLISPHGIEGWYAWNWLIYSKRSILFLIC